MTQALTDAGSIVGTLQYMSPEQLGAGGRRAVRHLLVRLVLYEILTGKPAFRAQPGPLIAAILEREPSPRGRCCRCCHPCSNAW